MQALATTLYTSALNTLLPLGVRSLACTARQVMDDAAAASALAAAAVRGSGPDDLLACRASLSQFSEDDDAMIIDWVNRWQADVKSGATPSLPAPHEFSLRTAEEEFRWGGCFVVWPARQ
jgi:hypothetical protein